MEHASQTILSLGRVFGLGPSVLAVEGEKEVPRFWNLTVPWRFYLLGAPP